MDDGKDVHHDIVGQTACSEYFDEVIGHIEDIVMSEKFQEMHNRFLESNWEKIEDSDENRLEYTDIFNEYTNIFENFFLSQLNQRMAYFDMERFAEELGQHEATTDAANNGEIFELLQTFSNFQKFKEIMLDYRSMKEGTVQHLDCSILITTPLNKEQVGEVNGLTPNGTDAFNNAEQ